MKSNNIQTESIFIDENELSEKYAERVRLTNAMMKESSRKAHEKYGVSNGYVGGVMPIIWSEKSPFEMNINNLFAAFSNNFAELIFFQTENIRMCRSVELMQSFLVEKGILSDFILYKKRDRPGDLVQNPKMITP